MPTPRSLLGAGVIGGKLYAVGGFVDSAGFVVGTSVLEVYDPQSNAWTTKAPMPHASGDLAVGVVNGILYAVGGQDHPQDESPPFNYLQAYDPATDTWSAKAPMPTARRALAVAVSNGKLYAIGGQSDILTGTLVATVEAYDPTTDSWSTKAPMSAARYLLAAATVNGIIYAVGGFDGTSALAVVEAYDPATDQWSSRTAMPGGVVAPAAAAIGENLFVVGGFNGNSVSTTVGYNAPAGTWSAYAPMPSEREGLAAGVIDSLLYAVGGQDEVTFDSLVYSTANEVFSPVGSPASNMGGPPP